MAFEDPYWTLNEAVSWAMWRLPEALAEHPYWSVIVDSGEPFGGSPLHLSVRDAERTVLHLIQRKRVSAFGGGGELTTAAIVAAEIIEDGGILRLAFALGGRDARPQNSSPIAHRYYEDLRISADELLKELPAPTQASSKDDAPLDGGGAVIAPEITAPSVRVIIDAMMRLWGGLPPAGLKFEDMADAVWDEARILLPQLSKFHPSRDTFDRAKAAIRSHKCE